MLLKALRDTSKEVDFDKRLNDIKTNYETNKYDELQTRLKDAESKNEYLSKIIAQLQSKRTDVNFNIGYVCVFFVYFILKFKLILQNYFSATNENTHSIKQTASNQNVNNNQQFSLAKLNLSNIYTVEPLRIKVHENDEPRPPTLEESEIFISKLYDLYKHQKQQVN